MGMLKEIQRYLLIIRKVRSTPYISLIGLQQEVSDELLKHGSDPVGCSIPNLKRDIKEIREGLHIPLLYSYTEKGYYFPEDEIWSPDNIERLLEPFDILSALNADTGLNHIVFPDRCFYRGTDHLVPLIKAIKDSRPVRFRYRKYEEDQPSERKVYPYAVKECRNRWYLLGIEEGQNYIKTFGLDRFVDLEVLSGKFRRDVSIDISMKYKDVFGIVDIPELPVEEVVLTFDRRDAEYVKSLPIHHSQQMVQSDTDGGEVTFRLHIKITEDLILSLLSRGTSLKVIRPLHLREKIRSICENMGQRNMPDRSSAVL